MIMVQIILGSEIKVQITLGKEKKQRINPEN